jgi:branched-chain amino acid transport system ATP-binding protein
MLALSRAVLRPGSVILLDEVSRGLSPAIASRLAGIIRDLAQPDRVIVIVEQYLHDALRLADTIYILRRGEVVFAGEPTELTTSAT